MVGLTRPEGLAEGPATGARDRRQQALRHRMGGHAHRLGIESGAGQPGHRATRSPRQHERERAWPEGGGEALGQRCRRHIAEGGVGGRVMRDQRVEAWPVLGRVDRGHGGGVRGIGAEAIDGLGREGDELARPEQGGGLCDAGRVGGKPDGGAAHAVRFRVAGGRGDSHAWQSPQQLVVLHITLGGQSMLEVAFSKPVPPKAGAVVVLLAEEEALTGAAATLNETSGGAIARAMEVAAFKGQKGKTVLLFSPVEGLTRLLVVGLGKRADLTTLTVEEAGGAIVAALSQETGATILADGLSPSEAAHLGLGAVLRAYRFDLYRTKEKPEDKPKLTGIIVQAEDHAKAKAAFAPLRAVAEGIYLARDLVTEPPNVLTPTEMADRCRALTKLGVKVEILGPKELEKLGFGALLGVSMGSVQEPRMVVMQWNGAGGRKPRKPLVFVGKGVTFDTGGISHQARRAAWKT